MKHQDKSQLNMKCFEYSCKSSPHRKQDINVTSKLTDMHVVRLSQALKMASQEKKMDFPHLLLYMHILKLPLLTDVKVILIHICIPIIV